MQNQTAIVALSRPGQAERYRLTAHSAVCQIDQEQGSSRRIVNTSECSSETYYRVTYRLVDGQLVQTK
jgi:hypothetical protein